MEINGHIQNGIVVPDGLLPLPDGTEVTIVLGPKPSPEDDVMSAERQSRYLDALARIDAVTNENSGDTFRGSDHDQALYGECP